VPAYRHELALSHYNLGVLLKDLGKLPEAESAFRQALHLQEQLAADFPTVPRYRQVLASCHHNLGTLLAGRGKHAQAEAAFRQALAIEEKLAADFPAVPEYRQRLAHSCTNYGTFLYSQKRAQDCLEWFARAIPLLQADPATNAPSLRDRMLLRNAHANRARALTDLRRYPQAVQDWDRAIELDQGPLRPAMRLQRALALAHAGDHAKAAAEADDLTRDDKTPGDMLYDAACVCGLSVPAAKDDAQRNEQYAGQALALLRRARAAGFFDDAAQVEHVQKDDDLAALRDRADFQQFVTELKKKPVPLPEKTKP
jgi:tetratricopeptide (TPR) repeat protein